MATPDFKAVIFDMDGVIVDSEPRHQQAFREVFEEMGYGETHGMVFDDYLGKSDKLLWEDFIAKHQPEHSLEHLIDWRQNRFIDIIRREEPLFTGIPELIIDLKSRMPIAVASGSLHPVIDAVLALEDIRQHFSAVISSSDVARGKPAPDIFLRAAEALDVSPKDICVIEDSEAGIAAGVSAGMHVIAITNSLPKERLQAAHDIVDTYTEVRMLLGLPETSEH